MNGGSRLATLKLVFENSPDRWPMAVVVCATASTCVLDSACGVQDRTEFRIRINHTADNWLAQDVLFLGLMELPCWRGTPKAGQDLTDGGKSRVCYPQSL